LASILMAAAQRLYYRRLASHGRLRFEEDVAKEILAQPRRLFWIASAATYQWLRALAERQSDPTTERFRLATCLAVLVMLASFVWMFSSFVSHD
jgi:hypothetical protein